MRSLRDLENYRIWRKKLYDKRKAAGLCTRCGGIPHSGLYECDKCRTSHAKSYKNRSEKVKGYAKLKRSKNFAVWQKAVLNHYGSKCACCGEDEPMFLTVDHVNNDGNIHRKEQGKGTDKLYRWLVKNNFPEGFQLLCWNCNCGKHRNGGVCPHTKKEVMENERNTSVTS